MSILTAAELASRLHNREYRNELSRDEEREAKNAGLLIVFGASDDLVEFRGAFHDETGAAGSATVRFHRAGILPDWDSLDKSEEDAVLDYFELEQSANQITAHWDKAGYSWFIEPGMGLAYAAFDVVEDGERFCRGVVIDLNSTLRGWRTTGPYEGNTDEVAVSAAVALREIFPAGVPEPSLTPRDINGQSYLQACWRDDRDSLSMTLYVFSPQPGRLRLLQDGGRHIPVVDEDDARATVDSIMYMAKNIQ
ncbi:Uncharacterised protein [Achromobacter sp. 2789STDY5608633]|jgi:hypothetical protein|uniref:hypothetical protein n=1 Tax=Pseudomonadota TaxID=1224 RepID=UPI0006C327C2|nr:hypothetical protein [Achromobacter sp. 2789STDY5608633]CUJ50409.1 Uncharacterised protein [Achromobacter sp. 2789STDY5608633]